MTSKKAPTRVNREKTEITLFFGLMGGILFFVLVGIVSYWNVRILNQDASRVAKTHNVINGLDNLLSLMKDAETGQRGYIITGNEEYLEPYSQALTRIDEHINSLKNYLSDNPEQLARIPVVTQHVNAKLQELEAGVALRRSQGFDASRRLMLTDRGKGEMDALRTQLNEMRNAEQALRAERIAEMRNAYWIAVLSGLFVCAFGIILIVAVVHATRKSMLLRQRQEWLQSGQVGLTSSMLGEQKSEQLAENVLKFVSEYVDAQAAAFFVKENGSFKRIATYGIPQNSNVPEQFGLNDGLLGQAAKDGKTFLVKDVPENYITVGSALGRSTPRHLVISVAKAEGFVNAVIEFGFIHAPNIFTLELLEQISDSIGLSVKSANYRAHLQKLLEETQRQAEELQAQGEELKVNNEELEEQSRALKESQTRLEHQQVEMEQTNAQLEEQAQLLEAQRDDLFKTKAAVQLKAQELEQASQYKSDFLANMSHELRTPLNSSLILAKLLADNPAGNLTEEQVRFAETIQSSGNDLLTLINDILDLSKIEAGHMEVRPESFTLERLVKDLTRTFEPIASQKGLKLNTNIAKNMPEMIETDRQRLEQVLKNLLSNALKFTEKGKVELSIERVSQDRIRFAINDTGIGIAEEQQQAIFEAFRQADGTISRKYGGTGLGLSISRELARLLGGAIELTSEAGKGSTFTVTIPAIYDPSLVAARTLPVVSDAPWNAEPSTVVSTEILEKTKKPAAKAKKRGQLSDDRERLTGKNRTILVIEDDESFARILYDLAHERNFQCLIATTAEEALEVAKEYIPNAVVLDVGLPDNSGLSVLDRLKRDARTRHIPVHVVSASDYAHTAFSLGAAGYMLKPVKRKELVKTLKSLEEKFAQRMRRILIVEDDAVQRDSMRKLLGAPEVETVAVGTAAECLNQLKDNTFDCMVLDLSLPDASGYSLLETLSKEEAYAFPPVIVYTGRDLSADEEQRLRRYSKSIIIKGAKSPERLLDEVTLFLHQVVAELPPEQQRMLEKVRSRDAILEGRRILVVEDDIRNVYALTSIFEPRGASVQIARNGREALDMLQKAANDSDKIDLVLMDVMMPEMDGLTATREIRKNAEWKKLPVIMLTAKAMKDDQERCLQAGANDYMAKPLDVEKLLSLVRVWMPR